jgi:hypothetical protein
MAKDPPVALVSSASATEPPPPRGIGPDGQSLWRRVMADELANRAFVVRTLARLGLNFEPVKPSVGRPGNSVGWSP